MKATSTDVTDRREKEVNMAAQKPSWMGKVERVHNAGLNPIIIHNNIEDELVFDGQIRSVRDVALELFDCKGRFTYSVTGWDFDSDDTELAFRTLLGLPLVPEDPGPMPDTEDSEAQFQWQMKFQRYKEWQGVVAEGAKRGLSEVQCLPRVFGTLDFAAEWIDTILHTRWAEEALTEDPNLPDPRDYLLVVDVASFIMPSSEVSNKSPDEKKLTAIIQRLAEINSDFPQVVMFSRSLVDLDKELYGRGAMSGVVEVTYPEFSDRYAYLKQLKHDVDFKLNGTTLEDLAHLSSGLSNRHLRSLAVESVAEGKPIKGSLVSERKQDILSDELTGLVELITPSTGFELIGGLQEAKDMLMDVVRYIREEKSPLVPMGILLVGPPGTGKTVLAEALAKELGYNFIRPGNIKSKWVGESQKNLTKMFEAAVSLAPVVIFYDEIDQGSGRGDDGDAGVSKEMFGAMLRFMSDTSLRGRVLTIGASNRPDLIDTAMKRPGRFDIRVPVLYPDETERAAIFQVMFHKYDLTPNANINFGQLAKNAENYSGADIECVVLEAARISERNDRYPVLSMGDLVESMEDYLIHHDLDAIQKMETMALKECNSIRMMPERYRTSVKEQMKKS